MCEMLNPSSFNFSGAGDWKGTSCTTNSCCCPEGQWAVKSVSKGGTPVERTRFRMREDPSPASVSYGTLICNTNTAGTYTITLNCNRTLTATVS